MLTTLPPFSERFGKRYELPLLLQSGIMIATMLAMMHICTAVKLDQVTVSRRFKGRRISWWPECPD